MKTNRKVLYWAIVYCVIIGIVYVTLSVLALFTRWCKTDNKVSTFIYLLYIQFFRVDKCEPNIDWKFLNKESLIISVDLPSEALPVQRTYIFTMSILALHAALIAVSIIALVGVVMSCVGRKSFIVFLAPLISVLIAIIVCDALATVYYIIDLLSLWKIDGLIEFLEIVAFGQNEAYIRNDLSQISIFSRVGPALVMVLTTSKLFLFWILNIFICILITKHGWSLASEFDEEDRKNYQNAITANDNPAFEDENSIHKTLDNPLSRSSEINQQSISQESANQSIVPKNQESVPEQRYHDTSRSIDYVYPHQIYAKSKKQKTTPEDEEVSNFRIQRPKLEVQAQTSRPSSTASPPSYESHMNSEIENRLSRYQETNGNAIKTAFAYENVPKVRENPYAVINVQQKEVKVRPVPPKKPTNNKFYLQNTGHEEQQIQYRSDSRSSQAERPNSNNLKAPEVLRSQLPWSYFKSGENAPRRTLMHDEHPDLPLPDYNSPVKNRRNYNSDFDDDKSWSYQRY